MNRITFMISDEQKQDLKIKAIKENKTLTQYIQEKIGLTFDANTDRIKEINNILQTNGTNMTKEERDNLKAEREQLKKGKNI